MSVATPFVPNVVALTDGSYHGGLSVGEVPVLAEAVRTGRALPSRLRGRTGMPTAAQAADFFLRERLGETSLQAVRIVATTPVPSDLTCSRWWSAPDAGACTSRHDRGPGNG